MEDYSVSVEFSLVNVEVDEEAGEDAIGNVKDAANSDPIGNSIIHDINNSHPATVKGNKHMTARMNYCRDDPYVFSGKEGYQGNTLKHEFGHLFGLRDRTQQTSSSNAASYIANDLMSYDYPRNNGVQPFIRVLRFAGLIAPGTASVIVNKTNREEQE